MQISTDVLAKTCKNTIETILLFLDHAVKGTIYTVGAMPDLQTVRVTSGMRNGETGAIGWGLPQFSDYNAPGKGWLQYRDEPGRVLEAMAWCVERQQSWTADNPSENIRSVRKQLQNLPEDYHHMEPVLVRKADLYGTHHLASQYPRDWQGNPIWRESEYIVVAVIKFHFLPQSIRRGDRTTKIIKRLSRTLGTELLSLHLREGYLRDREKLSRERLRTSDELAHELRNTLAKLGFVFSAINTLMSFLRAQWESEFTKAYPSLAEKGAIIAQLEESLRTLRPHLAGHGELIALSRKLSAEHKELADLFLLPEQEAEWVRCRIRPKWERLLAAVADPQRQEAVEQLMVSLTEAIWRVVDEGLASKMDHLPEPVRTLWPQLAYTQFSAKNSALLKDVVAFLEDPQLCLHQRQQLKRALAALKALVEIISKIEDQANDMISSLRNGESPRAVSAAKPHVEIREALRF